ncbi:hypothetical protein [Streptomyces sp. NPDC048172]|uniref:hypothetical protein n=1 Tax=Streptomyces sp. NPDC048172 TaxID=3365505 RepID=UPI003724863F
MNTATVNAPATGIRPSSRRRAGDALRATRALRAVRVFAGAAFSVAVLGACDEPGVVRRHR